MNHNHNGHSYAHSRYAQEFLDSVAEHKFARRMVSLANTKADEQWTIQRAFKCMRSARRHRMLTKKRLDRYRFLLKSAGGNHELA